MQSLEEICHMQRQNQNSAIEEEHRVLIFELAASRLLYPPHVVLGLLGSHTPPPHSSLEIRRSLIAALAPLDHVNCETCELVSLVSHFDVVFKVMEHYVLKLESTSLTRLLHQCMSDAMMILAVKISTSTGLDFSTKRAKLSELSHRLDLLEVNEDGDEFSLLVNLRKDDLTRAQKSAKEMSLLQATTSFDTLKEALGMLCIELQERLLGGAKLERSKITAGELKDIQGPIKVVSSSLLSKWTPEEDERLRQGVQTHGMQWKVILEEGGFPPGLVAGQLKDRFRMLKSF